jgi:CheY-like chemotaxis protein
MATSPVLTGSPAAPNTIGIVDVACFAAATSGFEWVTMTSTLRRTNSAAISATRSLFPSTQRYSIVTVRPAAIAILETRPDINLVFTDIDMPGSMDGLKLAACVRDRWPPVHIIITTGKARPATIPANALFIAKLYLGRNVVAAMQTFENM